jgi:two-component system chemotaxis sensor kinase CheA
MFITAKRHEREKQQLLAARNRITEAILHHSDQGLFLLDAKDRIQPQVSRSLATLFRRQDFSNLSFEKLVAPLVTAKMLTVVRNHIAQVLGTAPRDNSLGNQAPVHLFSAPEPPPADSAMRGGPPGLENSLRLESSIRLEGSIQPESSLQLGRSMRDQDPKLPASLPNSNPLNDLEVRLPNGDGGFESAHYSFDIQPLEGEPRLWLVRVADITREVQAGRELEELQSQVQAQGEILRSVLQMGGARFAALVQRTDASMKTINAVLKKPAREQDAFRGKLEEALDEVDRVRRDAAAFKLSQLEGAARQFEDSLHDLRSRNTLSGSDFLPLAVKLDQLYGQFAALKSLTAVSSSPNASPNAAAGGAAAAPNMTENGTEIIRAPKFMARKSAPKAPPVPGTNSSAPAGSLENTLRALTEHVAEEHKKAVVLDVHGLHLVPQQYQAAVKNVAIQFIRNAVMHGIESPATRQAAGKPPHGTLRLEFKSVADRSFELLFEDDGCGLDPDQVRATAIARGVIPGEGAARLRDREAIKLIFKSAYSTLESAPGEPAHGSGLSLVRRYVHEAGGRVALASLLGHETRFKVALPALADAAAAVAAPAAAAAGN